MKINILHGSSVGTIFRYFMLLFALIPLQSFALTWTGSSPVGSNWLDSANWGGVPIARGDDLVFAGNLQVVNTNGTGSRSPYSSITFDPTAGPFVLTGNLVNIMNGITNDSLNVETVDLGISFSNSITLDGESNTLYILAGLTNSVSQPVATTITLAGVGVLNNLFTGDYYPLETNIFATTSNANWSLQDLHSARMTGPWIFQIKGGTFNFGSTSSAPQLISTTQEGSPLDYEVGSISGVSGTLNVNNGTLTISSDISAATAANSTGIINIHGGTLNVSNGLSSIFLANSGTGTLNISSGVVLCGTLDLSGNAAGNTFSSAGTVHLDGGLLAVSTVTNASINAQSGGNPTATFYFNGGKLIPSQINSQIVFEGSRVPPVMPITTYVQAGGAFLGSLQDTLVGGHPLGAVSLTMAEPLLHDAALGGARDGGLTTYGLVVLTGTNTYNGDTVDDGGFLELTGSASIANSSNIILYGFGSSGTSGGTFIVSGLSSTFTLNSNQTLQAITASGEYSPPIIGGNFNAGSGTLLLNYEPGLASLTISNGVFNLTPNTVLKITNAGTPIGAGTYTIIDTNRFYPNASGMVAGTLPSSFTVSGGGIAPGDTASLLITNLQLYLVVTPPTPHITGVSLNGAALTLTATNGAPGGRYVLLESTNLLTPFNLWTPVLTNVFDSSGNLSLTTNVVSPQNPTEFYLLSQ